MDNETQTREAEPARNGLLNGKALMNMPIEVTVSIGRARPALGKLLAMQRDEVLALDSRVDDPVELFIGDRLIARGELEEAVEGNGKLAVRLTEVVDMSGVA